MEVQSSPRTKHTAEYVHLRDPRAAGRTGYNGCRATSGTWESAFTKKVRDSGTNFFFEYLPVGQYTFKTPAARQPRGSFPRRTRSDQSLYAPEFTAYSAGHMIRRANQVATAQGPQTADGIGGEQGWSYRNKTKRRSETKPCFGSTSNSSAVFAPFAFAYGFTALLSHSGLVWRMFICTMPIVASLSVANVFMYRQRLQASVPGHRNRHSARLSADRAHRWCKYRGPYRDPAGWRDGGGPHLHGSVLVAFLVSGDCAGVWGHLAYPLSVPVARSRAKRHRNDPSTSSVKRVILGVALYLLYQFSAGSKQALARTIADKALDASYQNAWPPPAASSCRWNAKGSSHCSAGQKRVCRQHDHGSDADECGDRNDGVLLIRRLITPARFCRDDSQLEITCC